MRFLPVVGRELGVIARRPSAYWTRSVAAAAAFLAMGYVALIGAAGLSTLDQGKSLFELLSLGAFAFCIMAGVRGTSDALSQEKREGTLGLLFLTDLKGYDVVLGKLASVSVNSLYGLLSIAPALALAFMLGGTSVLQFGIMIAFLFNTLFFSLAVGICVSTFAQNERPAMGITLAIIFCFMAMPYGIATAHTFGVLEIWEVLFPGFLLESPIYTFTTIRDSSLLQLLLDEVLLSMAFTHLAGWLCLVVACACLAQRAHLDAPRGRVSAWFLRLRQDWAYGKASRRRAIRGALLDRSAFAWLAGRDRLKGRYPWVFIFFLGGLWAVARWQSPEIMEEWPITLVCLWFLQLFFKVWVASEVAARFIEDRRSNALELLLTTALKVKEFARGERLALFRQFGAPIAAIILLNLIAAWNARDSSAFLLRAKWPAGFFLAGLVHLTSDLYAIFWISIWRSLHLRGTNRTISQTISMVIFLPVVGWFFLWQGSWLLAAMFGGNSQASSTVLWIWTGACVLWDFILAMIARNAFHSQFREVAARAFEKPERQPLRLAPKKIRIAFKSPALSRMRKIAAVVALILVIFNVWAFARRHRLAAQASQRLAAARTSGLPLTVPELNAWKKTAPEGRGASAILRDASKFYTAGGPPPELRDRDTPLRSHQTLPADFKAQAQAWIKASFSMFKRLEQLPTLGPGGIPHDQRFINPVRADELATSLKIKAFVEMETDRAAAAKTITLLLHLARTLEGEAYGSFGGARKTLETANVTLGRAAWLGGFSAEQWREWHDLLVPLNPTKVLYESLVAERVEGLKVFSLPVESLFAQYGNFMDVQWIWNFSWAIRKFFGQHHAEVTDYLDEMERQIANSQKPFWQLPKTKGPNDWRRLMPTSRTVIAPQMIPAFHTLYTIANTTLAQKQILLVATSVEIFRAKNGKLPETLREIGGPEIIDPFDGKPIRYIRRGNEYIIYSIAEDGIDNGGREWTGRQTGDLIFYSGQPPLPERKGSANINKP